MKTAAPGAGPGAADGGNKLDRDRPLSTTRLRLKQLPDTIDLPVNAFRQARAS